MESKAIRKEVVWTVAEDGLSFLPTAPQFGGVQGEDNAVVVKFVLGMGHTLVDNGEYKLYIECEDSTGAYDKTEPLTPDDKEGAIKALVPLAWTQHGGTIRLNVVAEGAESDKVILESVQLYFRNRTGLTRRMQALIKTHIQKLLDSAADMLKRAEDVLGIATNAASSAAGSAHDSWIRAQAAANSAAAAATSAESAKESANTAMAMRNESRAYKTTAEAAAQDAAPAKQSAEEAKAAAVESRKQSAQHANQSMGASSEAVNAKNSAKAAADAAAGSAQDATAAADAAANAAVAASQSASDAAAAAEEAWKAAAMTAEQNKVVTEKLNELDGILNGTTTEVMPEPDPVETVTVRNVIDNSQFTANYSGWTMTGGDGVDMAVADGVLCLTETAPTSKLQQLRSNNVKSDLSSAAGHRLYMYAKVKYEGKLPPTVGVKLSLTENTYWTAVDSTSPIFGEWCYMSSMCDYIKASSSGAYVVVSNNYGTTNIVGAKCYVDAVMCIDLTATFGAGNEPDLATMDRWITEQYADGFAGTVTLALTAEDDGEGDEPIVKVTPGLVEKVATLGTDVAGLKTEVAGLAEAMENFEVQQTGTVYPTLHEHFIANIEAAKPDYYGKQDANTLTFAMMADMHLLANNKTILPNVEASSAWAKLVNHDFVMMGGDFIIGDESKAASLGYIDALMEMAEEHANCPVYALKGNHDSCDGTDNKADRITQKEFYLHANARGEKHGMVIDPAHPYAGYYYVDFPRQKIRMVCLNTTEIKEDVDILTCTNSQLVWAGVKSTYQVEWVRDVALRVPEGWAVMMFSHIPPITGADLGVTDTGDYADTGAPFHNRGIKSPAIVALCKAFAEGTSGTANVTESGSVKINYDFTDQGAREFIGHFCGHVHEDSLSVYNGMNYVVVNSTTPTKRWATSLDRTASEDKLSLNSFIVNRATRTVECIKIGASPSEDNAWWADSFTW